MHTSSTYKLGATLNVPEETKTYLVPRMKNKTTLPHCRNSYKTQQKIVERGKIDITNTKKSPDFSSMAWKFE